MSVRFIFLRPRDVYDTTAFKGRVLPTELLETVRGNLDRSFITAR
jgi:hypothetical protein